jgi:hypothetical protein
VNRRGVGLRMAGSRWAEDLSTVPTSRLIPRAQLPAGRPTRMGSFSSHFRVKMRPKCSTIQNRIPAPTKHQFLQQSSKTQRRHSCLREEWPAVEGEAAASRRILLHASSRLVPAIWTRTSSSNPRHAHQRASLVVVLASHRPVDRPTLSALRGVEKEGNRQRGHAREGVQFSWRILFWICVPQCLLIL